MFRCGFFLHQYMKTATVWPLVLQKSKWSTGLKTPQNTHHTSLEQGPVQNEGPPKIPVFERQGLNLIHLWQGFCTSELYLSQLNHANTTQYRPGHKKMLPASKWPGNLRRGEARRDTGSTRERMSGQVVLEFAGVDENWHGYNVQ